MTAPYSRAPHVGDRVYSGADASPHAALLIDFDNVTMGRRSDLTRELRSLLDSEIIKGKVAVQRAYADWRRYPQYIVPLSEASIDLIFAPAYGSSKKNATDIRMAIDALELIFIRPEIGTFILLTGDSDFSSVVLKLKEYGKYVIGVGIQESSSDILVQNCDEYYSYTSITGLTKTDEAERVQFDPWVLVQTAAEKMASRKDVMRSDRLKQVMREIDRGFDESEHGYGKFSKFLAEASRRGLVKLRKLDNGQYEVAPGKKKSSRRTRGGSVAESEGPPPRRQTEVADEPTAPRSEAVAGSGIDKAYELMREALGNLAEDGRAPARDSDVKRRMLVLDQNFDEAEFGFSKFSVFLKQAADDGVVQLDRNESDGFTEVALTEEGEGGRRTRGRVDAETPTESPEESASEDSVRPRGRRTRPRGGSAAKVADEDANTDEAEASTASEVEERAKDQPRSSRGRRSRGRGSDREEVSASDSEPDAKGGRGRGRRGGAKKDKDETQLDTQRSESSPPEPRPEPTLELEAPAAKVETPKAETPKAETPKAETPETQTRKPETRKPEARKPETRKPETQRTLHPRQVRGKRGSDGPPPFFAGQTVPATNSKADGSSAADQPLPSEPAAIERYLTEEYRGVGQKTAQQVVEAFGGDTFEVLDNEPNRVTDVLSERRAEQLLEAWEQDQARRAGTGSDTDG